MRLPWTNSIRFSRFPENAYLCFKYRRGMKKYYCFLIIIFLYGCAGTVKKEDIIHVSVLRGPTAIAFAQWLEHPPALNGKKLQVKIIDSPDLMQAGLIKKEADIAAIPMINAANLYNKGIQYIVAGCPIWGTLYMVENKSVDKENKTLHIFGSGTTPDILTRYYLDKQELTYRLNYSFSTAREIVQGLYIGKIERAVLGEPFLSIALQRDTALQIVADLNNPEDGISGYPQTAILLTPALEEYRYGIDSLIEQSCRFATEKPLEAIRILEKHKVFPDQTLTGESIKRCEIKYIPSSEADKRIWHFLELIYSYEPKAVGGKLPDKNFINGKL